MKEISNKNSIKKINYSDEMRKSYIDYAMSVIVGRAIPDVRDGFKPVHRRILYSMLELGIVPKKPYRKSARIVGDVLGKYHPHGDTAVYEAMVRLAQDFRLNNPLIDGHGNWGSIDGDSAAAMRYTEAKLTEISLEMLKDLEKEVIEYQDNFDGELKEPTVLPARFPNLLVNGSSGIAVGMATEIPTHNLSEVIDGAIALIENEDITTEKLMKYIKGPDFPTGGIITNKDDLLDIYKTGVGKVYIRAKINKEEVSPKKTNLVVTEIPYYNCVGDKTKIITQIADMIRDKKMEELSDIRDESDRNGIRIVLELKKDVNVNKLLNKLYDKTKLQDSKTLNFLAIVNGEPKVLSLKRLLKCFVDFQIEINTKKYKHLLQKAQSREEVLEGLIKSQEIIDLIIEILRGSNTIKDAKECMIFGKTEKIKFKTKKSEKKASKLCFTEKQTDAILEMKLQKLVNLEEDKLKAELEEILVNIAEYTELLSNVELMKKVIKKDLRAIKKSFGKDRKTEIANIKTEKYIEEEREEEVYVLIDKFGYTKTVDTLSYTRSNEETIKEYKYIVNAKNTDKLCIFTEKGNMHQIKLKDIPKSKIKDKGILLENICKINKEEIRLLSVNNNIKDKLIMFITKKGLIKIVEGNEFDVTRSVISSTNLEKDDELIDVILLEKNIEDNFKHIILCTNENFVLKFEINSIPILKKSGKGLKSMTLADDDYIRKVYLMSKDNKSFVVKINGKDIDLTKLQVKKRNDIGILM